MNRLSISFTDPNNQWMNRLLDAKEYSSKSELVNDLIRLARQKEQEQELIRMKLERAEKSGFTQMSAQDILDESKNRLNG